MAFSLEIVAGHRTGARYALAAGRTLVVGRSPQASLSFPEDNFMSGSHFSLATAEDGVLLRDLKSSNGTFINGRRLTEAKIKLGDVISAGSLEFRLSLQASVPAAVAT